MRLGEKPSLAPEPEVCTAEPYGSVRAGVELMKAILCGSAKCAHVTAGLERLIDPFVTAVEVCRELDELSLRLRDPAERICLIVLVAADEREIEGYVSLADLFDDIRILLVLLEENPRALLKAHSLRPRLLVTGTPDPAVIGEVLGKMLKSRVCKERIREG